ncbi:MAG: diguanylate cyclase [Phycisphaerales bacterium]|nr:diguanylate cyclase [Phycisphaerales bacterium]
MTEHETSVDVCLIEDDAQLRHLLMKWLIEAKYSVMDAGDGAEGLGHIMRHRPRIVLTDLQLPLINGIDICKQVRSDSNFDGTYIIVMTEFDSRENKHRALGNGADDFLAKPVDFVELNACLRNGFRVQRLQERLRRAALTDGLTGLANHSSFRGAIDREFARTRRYGGCVSLLMLDLDHFKAINDNFGHEMGNRVLKATARHLSQAVRDVDVVARYGGEEFAVICPQTSGDEAGLLADRIRRALPDNARISEAPQLTVTASVGTVCSNDSRVASVNDLINLADQALYAAKRRGRNQVVKAEELGDPPIESSLQVDVVERLRKQVVTLSMQSKELCVQCVWSLVQALEARDPHTAWHSRNVSYYTQVCAEAAGWPESFRSAVVTAAMLHDLGKIGIPDSILQKADALTPSEAAEMRKTPLLTCKILEPLRIFETEMLIIRHLRERFDGSGYPDGVAGQNIPIGSRLLAVTEAFDAMTSDRVHRPHRSMGDALAELRSQSGRQFDPQFVSLLEKVAVEQSEAWVEHMARSRMNVARRTSELLFI